MTTTMNVEQLKLVNRTTILTELKEKTKKCIFLWKQLAPNQYTCSAPPFDFFVTKTNQDTYVLDVSRNGRFFRAYNSYTQSEVKDLYETVDLMLPQYDRFEKMRGAISAISQIGTCVSPRIVSNTGHGGIFMAGAAEVSHGIVLQPSGISAALTNADPGDPNLLTNPIVSGTFADIDESVDNNDGDSTRVVVRYDIATNPSYIQVKITFDQTLIPALRQFNKIRFRVVGKISNAADLVNGVLDYSVNSPSGPFGADAINFADLTSGYVVYDSGFVDLFTELYGNEFTTPLCIWFDVAPVSTEVGSQQRFYITASDLMLAKD